jgi:RND superfamily putative drug exporter
MDLLGDANWWLPRGLDRILPTIHLEEVPVPEAAVAGHAPARPPAAAASRDGSASSGTR